MSLWGGLTVAATGGQAKLHCWNGSAFETSAWRDVAREAEMMTAGLRRAGVTPGARVAAILTNSPLTVRGILGTWLAGGTLASFPVPARGMGFDDYARQLGTLVDHLQPAALFVDEPMLGLLPERIRTRANARSWESVADSGRIDPSPPEEDDVAFIQYSSGSTSVPKGCMLTAQAIERQLELIIEMIDARPGKDVNVSWLPLSHDMGIFGNLLAPWLCDVDLVLSSPERFMFSPRSWFKDVADSGATFTCGTNTALSLAARRHGDTRLGHPLKLRTIILGAECIEWGTLQAAVSAFGPWGLTPEILMPAYGLAEATLAVTATPREEAPRSVVVDAVALADGDVHEVEADDPSATRIVSSGVPVTDVAVPGLKGDSLTEIRISSPCLAMGYFGNNESTWTCFQDGEFLTGDLGFSRDGYLYPVGRVDDLLSIGGRKVYAREIEAAIDTLGGVRPGCSTIIETSEDGCQRLTLLIEVRDLTVPYDELAAKAADLAITKAGVTLDQCVFLPKDSLPKTPTGKIQRYRCRESFTTGRLESVATVDMAAA